LSHPDYIFHVTLLAQYAGVIPAKG
jgi:hypothetical protein